MKKTSDSSIVGITIMVLIAAQLVFQPGAVFACSCVPELTVPEAYDMAEAVFAGRVLSIKKGGGVFYNISPNRPNYYDVAFQVSKQWKGINEDVVTVATARQGTACGFDFEKNREYLVYARGGDFFETEFATTICSRTKLLASAEEDLKMRGPGEFFGTRQSGIPDLRMAKISDITLLELARNEAISLFKNDPGIKSSEHRLLVKELARIWPKEDGEWS